MGARSRDTILAREDIDGVFLATAHSLHEQEALQVLESGEHVFVETLVAMTAAGAVAIVPAAAKAGGVLGTGHERRLSLRFAR